MRYLTLGRTGLRVSELALGAMRLGAERAVARRVLDAYADAGGNLLDTADRYGRGASEELLGELLGPDRDAFVLGTKYTLETREGDVNAAGSHRKHLVRALDASLRRLRTDHVDVYWVHSRDVLTPVEEVMRALDDQVRAGKVLYVAVSDWPAWEVAQANTLADARGWTAFAAQQVPYSLLERTPERELQPMARGLGLATLAWSPLAGGRLARADDAHPVVRELGAVADEAGVTRAQAALAWLRTRPGTVIPILGARTEEQLGDALGCLAAELSPDHVRRLDAVSAIDLGFPYAFMHRPAVRDVVYGSRRADIEGLGAPDA